MERAVGYFCPVQGAPEEHLAQVLKRWVYCQAMVALVQPLVQDFMGQIWHKHYCCRLEGLFSGADRAAGADGPSF